MNEKQDKTCSLARSRDVDTAGQHGLLLGRIVPVIPVVPVFMLICANTLLSHLHCGSGDSCRDSGRAYGQRGQIFL